MKRPIALAVLIASVPLYLHAATFREVVDGMVVPFVDKALTPFLYSLAFLFFMYGMARYFLSPSEESREMGRQHAVWGIIALALLFAIWGVVRIMLSALSV